MPKPGPELLQCLLLSEDVISVDMPAAKESVTQHACSKQIKGDYQAGNKRDPYNLEPEWSLF
jgi:hypothetical protein